MAALNFPASPSVNDEYSANGATWRWNGTAWVRLGDPGAQGSPGVQGAQGSPGVQGAQGSQGSQGVQGTVGAQGNQGRQGAQGSPGVQGTIGAQGAQGSPGVQGAQGSPGVQGAQGSQGSQGVQGTVGAQGNQGVQGTIGAQGNQGRQGAQGAQGSPGVQGAQGAQGATGPTGGSNTQILYNSSGTATGSANMTFDGTRPTFATLRTNSILPIGGLPAGASGGGIIQIVQHVFSTSTSTTSQSYVASVVTGSITPRTTSNKIYVNVCGMWQYGSGGMGFSLYRGDSKIFDPSAADSGPTRYHLVYGSSGMYGGVNFCYLDSPASTSAVTYTVRIASYSGSTVYFPYTADAQNPQSTLTLLEVSG